MNRSQSRAVAKDVEVDSRFTMHLECVIRPCTRADLPKLEWYGQFTPHREIIRREFERHTRGENLILIADLNGFPAGQIWIDLARFGDEQVGYLWALRVFPFLKRLGIGKRLIRGAERELVRRDYQEAEITAEKGARAIHLYQRIGYQQVGTRYEEYTVRPPGGEPNRVPVDQVVLRKRLA